MEIIQSSKRSEIVRFPDGKYGVRKTDKPDRYIDLTCFSLLFSGLWFWENEDEMFHCCKTRFLFIAKYGLVCIDNNYAD